jgi:hypothetical protein
MVTKANESLKISFVDKRGCYCYMSVESSWKTVIIWDYTKVQQTLFTSQMDS